LGEPFADSSAIPTQVLARLTRGHVTVALGGDGGDEVFGGYDRYRALRFARRLDYLPRRLRRSLAAFAERMRPGHPKSKLARLRRFAVTLPMSAGERYGSIMRTFSVVDLQRLLPGEVALQEPSRVAGRYFDAYLRDRDLVGAAAALDRATYLPGDLLVKLDRCSMLHALEVRSPFMDRSLLRLAGTLGENGLLSRGRGKRLLRDAFAASLPASVFGRSKMGFAVPISAWLRGRLRPMTRDLLTARDGFAAQTFSMPTVHRLLDEHDRERADHGARLYALLMLELWHRQAREDERPSTSLVAA
ncbi:MAG: asparagine synthase-related protein, partial [Planctomycetota bacterium]